MLLALTPRHFDGGRRVDGQQAQEAACQGQRAVEVDAAVGQAGKRVTTAARRGLGSRAA